MNADYKFRLISIIAAFSLAFVCFTPALPLAAADSASAALTGTAADAPAASPTEVPSISFPDVYEHDWFYSDVMRLVSERIINGYPDGLFHPEREITTPSSSRS